MRPLARSLAKLFRPDQLMAGMAIGGVVLFVLGVTSGTFWTLSRIESAVRRSAERTLASVLANAREASRHWVTRQQTLAGALASKREVVVSAERALTAQARGTPLNAAHLPAQLVLESELRIAGAEGYWIIGADATSLVRWPQSLPKDIGETLGEALDRALDGLPSLGVFTWDSTQPARLLALAPIRGRSGVVIAVLALSLPADRELTRIAGRTHMRSLGRVWFFDRSGRVRGASFASATGMVPARLTPPGSSALTRMAASAVLGVTGVDLEGYTDVRGARVIGSWWWDGELGLGLAVESDVADAYHTAGTARSALLAALAITLLLFAAVVSSHQLSRRRLFALSALQRRLAAVLESTTDSVCFTDGNGNPIYLNEAGQRLLGHANGAESARRLLPAVRLEEARNSGAWTGEATFTTGVENPRTLSQVILCHRTPGGGVDFYSTIVRDITDRKRLEERLSEEKERAEVTLGSLGDAVIRTDARARIEYLNPVAETLLGSRQAVLAGRHITDVLSLVHETTRVPLENPVETTLRERRIVARSNHSLLIGPNGAEHAVDDTTAPITCADGHCVGAVLVLHDVSRARTLSRQLAHQASHDFLTGLVNRQEFERRVDRALQAAREDGTTHALCFLDLDQFKVVNDTCGHVAGDELLRQLAGALGATVRRRDTLSRLGGDEFGILLEDCPPDEATRLAQACLATVQQMRFVWEGKPFVVAGSIGVVSITAESESLAAVLRDADAACYAAKERGRNRVHYCEPNDVLMAARQGEMQWVSRITSALEESRFQLFGQPIVPLVPRPRERSRLEVLIRLVERDGTLIAPGAFIPAAERYNLMGSVDRWVVREVVEMFANHAWEGRRPIASINLSGTSLGDPLMLDFVREQLRQHDVPPEMLCFEITETAAIANLAQATHFIHELKALGCWFALDDFGSGMSSFGYLQTLPVDALKIAGAFLREIENDPVEYAMVEAINRVGHVMRLKTVAEGVENLESLETLRRLGVDYVQGFAVGEPVPLAEMDSIATPLPLTREAERRWRQSLRGSPRSKIAIV